MTAAEQNEGASGASGSLPRAPAVSPVLAALQRWGGLLVAPRAMAAAVGPGQGHRDGVWLSMLYLLGTGIYPLAESIATLLAVGNLGGLVGIGSVLGRALIAPILVLVAAETVLGRSRARLRGVALVPLVLVGTVMHALSQTGHRVPGPDWAWTLATAIVGVVLVVWIKPVVVPEEERA